MKIVCLIRPGAPLYYFVNELNTEYPITEVIIEKPKLKNKNLFIRLKKIGLFGLIKIFKNRFSKITHDKKIYNKWFSNKWKDLNKEISYVEVENINSEIVQKRLKDIKPDLILDHGTSIVKHQILKHSRLSLNLHWGLSPYYRGTHCTEWALINWDINNIGVTIHNLTKYIDGGEIYAQERAKIKEEDTVLSINMQLTFLGVKLIKKIIKDIKNRRQLSFDKQDYSKGFITYHRQWNPLLQKQIEFIEKNHIIKEMLINPSRKEFLPIKKIK